MLSHVIGCTGAVDGDGRPYEPAGTGPRWSSTRQLLRGLSQSHPHTIPGAYHCQAGPGAHSQVQGGECSQCTSTAEYFP